MLRMCNAEAMGGCFTPVIHNAHLSRIKVRYGRFGEHPSAIAALTLARINHTCAQRLIGLTLATRLKSAVAGGRPTGSTKSCQVR